MNVRFFFFFFFWLKEILYSPWFLVQHFFFFFFFFKKGWLLSYQMLHLSLSFSLIIFISYIITSRFLRNDKIAYIQFGWKEKPPHALFFPLSFFWRYAWKLGPKVLQKEMVGKKFFLVSTSFRFSRIEIFRQIWQLSVCLFNSISFRPPNWNISSPHCPINFWSNGIFSFISSIIVLTFK